MVTAKLYEKTGIRCLDADCLNGRLTTDGAQLLFVFITAQLQSYSCALGDCTGCPVSSLVALSAFLVPSQMSC